MKTGVTAGAAPDKGGIGMNNLETGTGPTLMVADLFCGAGGSSTGAERAIEELDRSMDLEIQTETPF